MLDDKNALKTKLMGTEQVNYLLSSSVVVVVFKECLIGWHLSKDKKIAGEYLTDGGE